MFDLEKIRRMGEPWCIWRPLTAAATLITPKASARLPTGIGGGQKAHLGDRVVILGFTYSMTGGASLGFKLVSGDQAISPGGTTDVLIWEDLLTDLVDSRSHTVSECFIALDGGTASPSLTNGANLRIVAAGGGLPTTGHIIMWGVIMPANEFLLTNRYRGSPFVAGTAPPN